MTNGSAPNNFRGLIGVTLVLAVAAIAAITFTISGLRSDAIEGAIREQSNLANVLGQQVSYSTQLIEKALGDVEAFVTRLHPENESEFRDLMRAEEVHRFLDAQNVSLLKADAISIVDNRGDFLASTRSWPAPPINIGDREHFLYSRDHTDEKIHIGVPTVSRVSNETTLFFTRRLTASDGTFIGEILVGMNLRFYKSAYSAMSGLKGKSMLLLRRDGTVLTRYPDAQNRAGEQIPAGSPWHALVANGGGSYRSPGYFDEAARLVAVHPLADFPFVVNVAFSEYEALAPWRARAFQIAAGALFALLCVACLVMAIRRQFTRLLVSEMSLLKKGLALGDLNTRFGIVLGNMPHGVALFAKDRKLIIANRRYGEMYRLSEDDVKPGTPLDDILAKRVANGIHAGESEHYVKKRLEDVTAVVPEQGLERLSDGRAVFISRKPMPSGGWLTVHEDVTARQHAEDQIAHLAHYDQLTDAANRSLLLERMNHALARVARQNERFAVLLIDLDDFKGVNDTYGHPVGDGLLKAVADRLRGAVRSLDLVARIGGDEFAILQANVGKDIEGANTFAQRILATMREPFDIDGNIISTFPSIGVAIAPDNGWEVESLLKNADVALYRAKTEGRNCVRYFDPKMDSELRAQRALKTELAEAISQSQLEVHYQPVLDAGSRETVSMEALVRWRHPERGMIQPDRFIKLAERTGLINPLGEFVLRTACEDATHWPEHVKVSVNLSPAQFKDGDLVGVISGILASTGLAANRLILEITESVLMENVENNLLVLKYLKDVGVDIALDDFGTGFSSLSYIQTFPLDVIKIDRSFVAAMQTRPRTSEIIALIVAMAKRLDISTVAEGVETQDQLDLLRAAGCDSVQGFFFCRPKKIGEFDFATDKNADGQQAA
jgi:diguanylate cyclase (GGDEF)-like protein